jgi:replicative DNA helicase
VYDIEAFEQISIGKSYGGRSYVDKIYQAFPVLPKNLDYHVEKLRVDAVKYNLRLGRLQNLVDACEDPTIGLDRIGSLIREINMQTMGYLTAGVTSGRGLYERYLSDIRARRKSTGFIPTGFDWMDEDLTEGLARKRVSIWTGRPSIGKSTVAWNLAERMARRNGSKVLYLALEMDTVGILDGIVSCRSGIELDDLVKSPNKLDRVKLKKINDTIFEITDGNNLVFWDKSLDNEKLARILAEGNYAIAIFDLYEKMVKQKTQDVIAADLDIKQQMAKDFDAHFALFHQTRRGVERRKNKRPNLEDLKNSGGYEEVADLVVALYREKYYNPSVTKNVMEMGILKQRRGKVFNWYNYLFEGAYGRIGAEVRDWDPETEEGDEKDEFE